LKLAKRSRFQDLVAFSRGFACFVNKNRSGVLLAFGSALAFAVMSYVAKQLSGEVPSAEITFARAAIGALILLPWGITHSRKLICPEVRFLLLRAIAGSGSVLCYFWTISRTTVANARAIADIAPLLVVFLGWNLLGEKPTRLQVFYVLIGAMGTTLLGIPGASTCPLDGWLIGICGAVCASLAYFSLRRIGGVFPTTLTVWIFLVVLAVVSLTLRNEKWLIPNTYQSILLIAVGTLGLIGQLLMTASYARLPAYLATAIGLATLPMVFLAELILDSSFPKVAEVVAYCLILLSVYLHARSPVQK
jgi:drug/metabolite transporter (DMT)-like permease